MPQVKEQVNDGANEYTYKDAKEKGGVVQLPRWIRENGAALFDCRNNWCKYGICPAKSLPSN